LVIQEDKLSAPVLDKSVPRINADDVHLKGYTGAGYAVAVLDTGVMSGHSFLAGRVISEACYSTTDSYYGSKTLCPNGEQSQIGTGAGVNCSTSISSGCSHGTHVAGIAAGKNGVPGNGVAPGANIIAIQVFSKFTDLYLCDGDASCVLSWSSDQILGLERVYALRGTYKIAAVNLSLGGGSYSGYCDSEELAMKAVIDNLRAAGVATAIASGNEGYNGYVSSPACISSAVTVGATESSSDSVASYSNMNSVVDLMAPGSDINSSIATCTTCYSSWNGTSMATPHVAGAFALMKSVHPEMSVSEIETWFKNNGVSVSKGGYIKPRIDFANLTYPSALIPDKVMSAINLLLLSGKSSSP
jgi:subtilisin family serine protease